MNIRITKPKNPDTYPYWCNDMDKHDGMVVDANDFSIEETYPDLYFYKGYHYNPEWLSVTTEPIICPTCKRPYAN